MKIDFDADRWKGKRDDGWASELIGQCLPLQPDFVKCMTQVTIGNAQLLIRIVFRSSADTPLELQTQYLASLM